jgi:acetyltransferase-like isoleucine patch superfamily enzyme
MARSLYDAVIVFLFSILTGVPAVLMGALAAYLGILPNLPLWRWALLPLLVLSFLILLLLTASLLRLLLPRLHPGDYPFPRHPRAFVWLLHFALQRMMYLPVWRHFLFSLSTLRWALLRALGAKAAFEMDTSADVLIMDLPMMELGAGTMIAAGSTLSGHIIENGRIYLGRVKLATGVQVGSNVQIGPDTTIGEHTIIGPECRISREVIIGEFAHLGAGCYLGTGVTVGDNAVLGHQVAIERGVVIGSGVVIRTGTRIARGTVVADGLHVPARSGRQA